MLYAISKGNVEGTAAAQSKIVHLVSDTDSVINHGCRWVFTDGHADMVHLSDFFDDIRHFDKIDWALMRATYWNDVPADPDRKRRRQAEFLVHEFFPWELVTEIGVINRTMEAEVREAVDCGAEIKVRRDWYY